MVGLLQGGCYSAPKDHKLYVATVIVVDADFYFLQMNQMKVFSFSILKFDLNEFVWFDVNLCMDARQLSLVVPTKTMCWLTQVTKDMRETTFGCRWTPVKAVRSHCCPQSAVDLVSHGKPVFAVLVTIGSCQHICYMWPSFSPKKMNRNETSQGRLVVLSYIERGLVNGFNFFVIAWMESLHPRKRWRKICRFEWNLQMRLMSVMSNKKNTMCNRYVTGSQYQISMISILGVW